MNKYNAESTGPQWDQFRKCLKAENVNRILSGNFFFVASTNLRFFV